MKNIHKLILVVVPFVTFFSCKGGAYEPKDPKDKEYSYEEFKKIVTNYYRPDYIKDKYKGNDVVVFHSFVDDDSLFYESVSGAVVDLRIPAPAYEGDIPYFSVIYQWDFIPTRWAIDIEVPILSPEYLTNLKSLEEGESPVLKNLKYKTVNKRFVISYNYAWESADATIEQTYNKDMVPCVQSTLSPSNGTNIDRFFYIQQ